MQKRKPPELNFLNLLLGLLLGFFLGGGLIYLNFNRQNDSLVVNYFQSLYEKAQQTFQPKFSKNYFPQSNLDSSIINIDKQISEKFIKLKNDSVLTETTIHDISQVDSSDVFLEINSSEIKKDTSNSEGMAGIIADKLLGIKAVILELEKSEVSASTRELDSLLGNIPSRRKVPDNLFYVEFWESPMNYQGYKMTKNKIIVYGITSLNSALFEIYKNSIYLNYQNEIFLIKETDVFIPLIPITDAYLINQIENQW
jgi:hypothetical protein